MPGCMYPSIDIVKQVSSKKRASKVSQEIPDRTLSGIDVSEEER